MAGDSRFWQGTLLPDDTLQLSQFLATPPVEEAVAMEAMRRGANEMQLVGLMWQWRKDHRQNQTFSPFARLSLDLPPLSSSESLNVWPWIDAYRNEVQQEFNSLPADVRGAFKSEKKEALPHYFELRPLYYCAGFSDPAETIFRSIVPAKLLGHSIGGGVHEIYKDVLDQVPNILNHWSKGLAEKTGKQIRGVGGFVPRCIAPKQGHANNEAHLSNHAFGLAIDIDPAWNPHIKDKLVIDALKGAVGYDFGKPFVKDEKGIPEIDKVAQTHLLAQAASRKVQEWLQKYLPVLDTVLEDERLTTPVPKGKQRPKPFLSSFRETAPECRELDVDSALQVERLKTILRFHERKDLEQWALHGIQSIPLALAAAMAELKLRWGTCYQDSKDMMHFEVYPNPLSHSDKRPLNDLVGKVNVAVSHHRNRQKGGR